MREDKSSRTKPKEQNKGKPKSLFSTVDFSKVDPPLHAPIRLLL
jgi:hypothetical protein